MESVLWAGLPWSFSHGVHPMEWDSHGVPAMESVLWGGTPMEFQPWSPSYGVGLPWPDMESVLWGGTPMEFQPWSPSYGEGRSLSPPASNSPGPDWYRS
ncbi:unnamed protein product [Gadus morhua 'NCC']